MSTSEQRSSGQVAAARLSQVEQENLWQLFKPTVLDLLRAAAGHSASRPIEEGEDAVQEVFCRLRSKRREAAWTASTTGSYRRLARPS